MRIDPSLLHPELSANVVSFARLLRARGVALGPQEQRDALQALALVDLADLDARLDDWLAQAGCADLDELRVQLALGKAKTRAAFEEQRRQLRSALQAVEQRIEALERKAEGQLTVELEEYVRLADRLRAEIDAAELQFWLFKAEQRDALEKGRRELQHRLAELRAAAKLHSKEAAEQVEAFEQRLAAELQEFRDSFRRLIGGHDSR